jgi:hypothetical protein
VPVRRAALSGREAVLPVHDALFAPHRGRSSGPTLRTAGSNASC